jgi:hypothetical protein
MYVSKKPSSSPKVFRVTEARLVRLVEQQAPQEQLEPQVSKEPPVRLVARRD